MEVSGLWGLLVYVIGIFLSIAIWFAFGFASQAINENKGYEGGFWWGFLLGWVGIIVVALKTPVDNTVYRPVSYSPPPDSWKCRCGRCNAPYVSSCVCGVTKSEAIAIAHLSDKEAQNIALLKEYKTLLDSGVITQEDFEEKKKSILSE